jgi:Uma2 family endonuclease
MASGTAALRDGEFPNLRPEVVAGFLAAPTHVIAQVIDGELVTMPRPRVIHAHAASRLGRRLGPASDPIGDDPGGWVILDEPELHLGRAPDIVVPDLAGWRRERMPEIPDAAALSLAPDWVCEVLSDATEPIDRGRKMRIWRREGVGHIWFVSPERRTLEAYRLHNGLYSLLDTWEGDAIVRAEPFEAIELPLQALWKL